MSSVIGLVIGDSALFQAYVILGARLGSLVMATAPILAAVMAWLFLGEQLSAVQILAIFLTTAAVVLVVTERSDERHAMESGQYRQGLLLAFVGSLGQAGNLVTAKFGLVGGFPALSATLIRIVIAAVILWGLAALRGQLGQVAAGWRDRRALAFMVGGAVVGPFLGIWLSLFAVREAPVGIASALMALQPVLLIPIVAVRYRQKVTLRAIVGTVAAVGGVALAFLVG